MKHKHIGLSIILNIQAKYSLPSKMHIAFMCRRSHQIWLLKLKNWISTRQCWIMEWKCLSTQVMYGCWWFSFETHFVNIWFKNDVYTTIFYQLLPYNFWCCEISVKHIRPTLVLIFRCSMQVPNDVQVCTCRSSIILKISKISLRCIDFLFIPMLI